MFQDQPVFIVEVVSENTRRIDEGEKRDRYLTIESLQAYVLLEQDRPAAVVYHRKNDRTFGEVIYDDPSAVLEFPELAVQLRLEELHAM